jgi:hypothetical protein
MIPTRTAVLGLVLMAGCATEPHQFRYVPPASVRAADREYCDTVARRQADTTYARYQDMMAVDALSRVSRQTFGGTALAAQAQEGRELAYEQGMRACLSSRGDSQ